MAFAVKIDALRQSFSTERTAAGSMPLLKSLFASISKQQEREKGAVYTFRELLDVYATRSDDERVLRDALMKGLWYLVDLCQDAEDSIKYYFVVRTYNLMAKMVGKQNNRFMLIQCCSLLTHCPAQEEHLDLLLRLCKVVLKVVCDFHGKNFTYKTPEEKQAISDGCEYICGTTVRLAQQWSQSTAADVRAKALAIYRDVFDNTTAYLYRLYSMDEARAQRYFRSVVELFRHGGKFSEHEMVDLFQQSLPYLESICSLAEGLDIKSYIMFADVTQIFERIEGKPTADYLKILRSYLKFQKSHSPDADAVTSISNHLRDLSRTYASDPLLVDVSVFITMQLRIHLDQMLHRALPIAEQTIDLCVALTKLVKNCPRDRSQICTQCGSSSRHLIDYVSTMAIQMAMKIAQCGDLKRFTTELITLVNGFLKHKLQTLDDLNCGRKQSLMDAALRFVGNWIRIGCQNTKGNEFSELMRLLVDFKYRYEYEFLTPSYLVRLVETTLRDSGASQQMIDVKLLRLVLVLRGEFTDRDSAKEIDDTVYGIMVIQLNGKDETIRAINIVQLMERPEMEKFGFPVDVTLNQQEKIKILLSEMNWISRYKKSAMVDCFNQLYQLDADPAQLGMIMLLLQEAGVAQVPEGTLESLKVKLQNARPKLLLDRIRRHGALATLNYYSYSALSKATINRMKNCQITRDDLKNDQITDALQENMMEKEMTILIPLEQTYENFREMVFALAEGSFAHMDELYSLGMISSLLDNTCRYFQISYFPRRSVEMQLLNYVLVSQKPERVLDLCCPVAFLLENNQIYKQLLENKLYQKPWVPSLETLSAKALEILNTPEDTVTKATDSRKFHFLSLYLSLALYEASRGNLQASITYLQKLDLVLPQEHFNATIKALARCRTYHVLFRLITRHQLPAPGGLSVRILIRLMLEHYNEIQKLTADLGFLVCTSTVDMTIEALLYQVVQYDTDRIEPNVEQILRFVLRRGSGLRAIQLLAMYATMCTDAEKEDKCQTLLIYLDRLLMLRPMKPDQKEAEKVDSLTAPVISLCDTPHGSDPTRKAVKYTETSPQKRSLTPKVVSDEPLEWRNYVIQHHTGCSCQFCRFPQFKCQALLVGLIYGRLSFLNDRAEQCQLFYGGIAKHWESTEQYYATSKLIGQTEEFSLMVARSFMQYGQFLSKQGQMEQARQVYDKSLSLVQERVSGHADLGLLSDLKLNIDTIVYHEKLTEKPKPKSRFPTYAEFLAANPQFKMMTPLIETNKMVLATPKAAPSRLPFPKTASKDGLLKQVARKRLKTALTTDYSQETGLINAMSGLSCASEKKPKTVNIFVDSPEKPTTKPKANKKKLFSQATYSQSSPPPKETPATAPKSSQNDSPISLSSASSNDSFKDVLVNGLLCSTPKAAPPATRTRARTTCKKPKLVSEYPKLSGAKTKSPKATDNNNHSFNGSFRDVLLKSLTKSTVKPKKTKKPSATSNNDSIIVLDDSSVDEVINSSILAEENHSVNASCDGVLSLKKYSARKPIGSASSRKLLTTKTRLQFDSSVVDITTPDGSPEVPAVIKRPRGRPRGCAVNIGSTSTDSAAVKKAPARTKVRVKKGAE